MAPIARNSVQAIRAIHCFHMIARKFYTIVPIARIEQSSIWAITIVPVAPIVPQLSVTVSIKSLGSSVHCFERSGRPGRSGRSYGNQALESRARTSSRFAGLPVFSENN